MAEQLSAKQRSVVVCLIAFLLALLCLRSWVFLAFPHSHLDSDQAVFGIMAKDIALGRAFPIFMYGQRYMLAVGSWLCAPLFLVFGISITTLKLPMFCMNVACVAMLWIGLRRELDRWGSALAILPFAACGVATASRLVEHQGGNIEPFFFLLLAFLVRERPIVLGIVFGLAFLNREFTPIGFIAMLLMDAFAGTLRRTFRGYIVAFGVGALTTALVRFVAAQTPWYTGDPAVERVQNVLSGEGLAGFFTQQLPMLLGAKSFELRSLNITSSLAAGHGWLYSLLAVWVVLGVLGAMSLERADGRGISTYLVLIGLGQAAAFILICSKPRHAMLIRYMLLCLCGWIGMTAYAWRRPTLRPWIAALVLLVSSLNVTDHVRLVREYLREPPVHENELLAHALLERGVKYAISHFSIAYDVTWLTNESVIITPEGRAARIARYRNLADSHASERVYIREDTCLDGTRVERWHLCKHQ